MRLCRNLLMVVVHIEYLYMYRATLKNLTMNTTYSKSRYLYLILFYMKYLVYRVGSPSGWSAKYAFRTIPNEDRKSFAVYGDLGVANAQSLARLQKEAQLDYYDAILHVGDFAYGNLKIRENNSFTIIFFSRYGCGSGF